MKAYWKIPKEWVQEWGLSPTEALVLSDIQAWPNCGHEERAKRVGLSPRQLTRIKDKMSSDVRTKCLIGLGQNVLKKRTKCPKKSDKMSFPPYNPLYIEEREEQEDITLDKSNVPKADASAVKKKSRKKPPEELSLVHRCRMIFEKYYLQKKGDPYYYLGAQDAMAIKQILQKIRFHMPDDIKDDEQKQEENFEIFVSMICSSPKVENWIIDNLSLGTINSKFNQIYSQLKNGTASAKPNNRHQPKYSAEFLADIAAGLAGGTQDIG